MGTDPTGAAGITAPGAALCAARLDGLVEYEEAGKCVADEEDENDEWEDEAVEGI
jgi:hypothetical protein